MEFKWEIKQLSKQFQEENIIKKKKLHYLDLLGK